eukprot:scaffold4963_cov115-Skeletonema_dohrnii-CCMP3373.AAC.5
MSACRHQAMQALRLNALDPLAHTYPNNFAEVTNLISARPLDLSMGYYRLPPNHARETIRKTAKNRED